MRGREATMRRAAAFSSVLEYNLFWLPLPPPPKDVATCVFFAVVVEEVCGTKACADRTVARYAVAVARPGARLRVLLREFTPIFVRLCYLLTCARGARNNEERAHYRAFCSRSRRWWSNTSLLAAAAKKNTAHVMYRVSPARDPVEGRTNFSEPAARSGRAIASARAARWRPQSSRVEPPLTRLNGTQRHS